MIYKHRTGRASTPEKEAERARKISEARLGMVFSAEHKAKLSAAKSGRKLSLKTRRRMRKAHRERRLRAAKLHSACRMCTSLKHTTEQHHARCTASNRHNDEQRRKECGNARPWKCKPRLDMRGPRNPRWNGGTSKANDAGLVFRRLRSLVFARDNHCCVQCSATREEQRLVIHHIDHDRTHNYLDNFVVLCHPDNVRAECRLFRKAWEQKFSRYAKEANHEIAFQDVAA